MMPASSSSPQVKTADGRLSFIKNRYFRLLVYIFSGLNLLIYLNVASKQAIGRPNIKAKLFMSGAATVTSLYIFPLSKLFGYQNITTKPFYLLRDGLYEAGLAALPPDDAEREMHWVIIRYQEFQELVEPLIDAYIEGKPVKDPQLLLRWTDELYEHVKTMPNNSFRDVRFKEIRFNLYYDVVWSYLALRPALYSEFSGERDTLNPFFADSREINKIKELLSLFLEFREKVKTFEPEGWNYFVNKTNRWFGDLKIISEASLFTIAHSSISGTFDCNNKYVLMYLEARTKLYNNVLKDSRLSKSMRDKLLDELNQQLDISTTEYLSEHCPEQMKSVQPIDMRNWRKSGQ